MDMAVKIYHAGGKYFSLLVEQNGGPFILGKQLIDEIPADLESFQSWRMSKISHFNAEDFRLDGLQRSDEPTRGGYVEEPNRDFPERPPGAKWMYVIDLQYDTLCVSLEECSSRMFRLENLPRWLFESAAAAPLGSYSIEHEKQLFIAPVSRVYLPAFECSAVPSMALLTHYESYAPKLCDLPLFPGVEAFPVRMYLRLILLTLFHNEHVELFRSVNDAHGLMGMEVFRWLLYCIVKLSRSSVDVCFRLDEELDDPPEHSYIVNKCGKSYAALCATPHNWVDSLPIVLERDISTTENLHAAISKAIQFSITSTRTPVAESAPSAIICSLTAIVLVYIRGDQVTHTRNIEFFPRDCSRPVDIVMSDGVLVLLHTLFQPSPIAEPRSFPAPYKYLPTEICQNIFSRACPTTRSALGASCRLFRAISKDHGLRIGDCYFQKRAAEHGAMAFVGEIYVVDDSSVSKTATEFSTSYIGSTGRYTRRTIVHLVPGFDEFSEGFLTYVVQPDWGIEKLDLPPVEAKELYQA